MNIHYMKMSEIVFVKVTYPLPFQMERGESKFFYTERIFSSVVFDEVFPSVIILKTEINIKVNSYTRK